MKQVVKIILAAAAVAALAVPAMAADKLKVMDAAGTTAKFVVTDTGKVGINTATPSGGSLHIVATDTPILNDILGNNQTAGMGVDISTPAAASPAGPVQAANWSFLVQYNNGGAGITNNFNTFRMIARTAPTVNEPLTGQIAAANFQMQHQATSTATLAVGFITNVAIRNTGNVTEAIAVDAASPGRSGTGTFTNAKGIRVRAQKVTGVTNGFAISQEGTADTNFFAAPTNQFPNLPVFADNTAASSLAAGTLYRTPTGVVMVKF